jgi:CBS domain-containing protein
MAQAKTAGDLMQTTLVTVRPEATLRETALALSENDVGVALVVGAPEVTGVVSERDIVTALADGANPDDDRVRAVMTMGVLGLDRHEPVAAAVTAMDESGVRHLVVRDGENIVGVLSARDLLHWYRTSGPADRPTR